MDKVTLGLLVEVLDPVNSQEAFEVRERTGEGVEARESVALGEDEGEVLVVALLPPTTFPCTTTLPKEGVGLRDEVVFHDRVARCRVGEREVEEVGVVRVEWEGWAKVGVEASEVRGEPEEDLLAVEDRVLAGV